MVLNAENDTVITNVVHDCADDMWETIIFFLRLSSLRQALQSNFDFPAPVTSRHSSGNSYTCFEAVILFGSLDPMLTLRRRVTVNTLLPCEIRHSWGLQSI